MPNFLSATASSDGFSVKAYAGDRCVMLAFNLEDPLVADLAGFAIRRKPQGGKWKALVNRVAFDSMYTADLTGEQRKWYSSLEAPFQKFWWVDFPPEDEPGVYRYEVTVMRFTEKHTSSICPDQKVVLDVSCMPFKQGDFELAFTRGYLSSQAYRDRFQNKPVRPKPKSLDYDTAPFQEAYSWLGAHARDAIGRFLKRCNDSATATLDVMVYDLDEPDIVKALMHLGPKVRLVADDASLHTAAGALEPDAATRIAQAGAAVVRGNFSRYQHNKVFVLREEGFPVSVLTGSTNFSVNGLYVNANHVVIMDGRDVAKHYADAFDLAFTTRTNTKAFAKSTLAGKEVEISRAGLPHMFLSFAPHEKDTFSLDRLQKELNAADSSILFAVMALKGSSTVLDTLRTIHDSGTVYSAGVTDHSGAEDEPPPDRESAGVTYFGPGKPGKLIESAALTKLVPPPFNAEVTAGLAHMIHHKFVVVDFNDTEPVVFLGSSNLAKLAEEENGDNLIAVYDRAVATAFAIEAVKLVDHYAFRAAVKKANDAKPLRLRFNDEAWWKRYYTEGHIKRTERLLFSR